MSCITNLKGPPYAIPRGYIDPAMASAAGVAVRVLPTDGRAVAPAARRATLDLASVVRGSTRRTREGASFASSETPEHLQYPARRCLRASTTDARGASSYRSRDADGLARSARESRRCDSLMRIRFAPVIIPCSASPCGSILAPWVKLACMVQWHRGSHLARNRTTISLG